MYSSKFYPLNLHIYKLIFWENYSFLGHGFYLKHNQNEIIFLMSYNSSSSDDMKCLTYGVSSHYITSAKMTLSSLHLPLGILFKFDLYVIENTCANSDALIII